MICLKCGSEVNQGDMFCANCGYKVTQRAERCYCPSCGEENAADAEFCKMCGKRIREYDIPDQQEAVNEMTVLSKGKRSHKRKKWIGVLVGVIILIIGGAGICWNFFYEEKSSQEESTDIAEEKNQQQVKVQEDEQEMSKYESSAEDDTEQEGEEDNYSEELEEYDAAEGGVHRYEYFIDDCSWQSAFEKARQSGGYLARINSREEYEYLISEITRFGYENIQFRIGGRRDSDNTEYYWVDENNNLYGELINGANYWANAEWLQGEPSFKDGDIEEKYLDFYYNSKEKRWVWNDVPDDIIRVVPYYSGRIGYIVEFEE